MQMSLEFAAVYKIMAGGGVKTAAVASKSHLGSFGA